MVQTRGLVLCSGQLAGSSDMGFRGAVLRDGVSRGGSTFSFGKRHAFRCLSVLRVQLSINRLGWQPNLCDAEIGLKR